MGCPAVGTLLFRGLLQTVLVWLLLLRQLRCLLLLSRMPLALMLMLSLVGTRGVGGCWEVGGALHGQLYLIPCTCALQIAIDTISSMILSNNHKNNNNGK